MRKPEEAYISALKRVIISLQSRSDAYYNTLRFMEIRSTIDGCIESKWVTANAEYQAWNDVMMFAKNHLNSFGGESK